ncbi:MAG: aminotransferase class V-fold PLP-dependent enzyme [Gammaproteobacteria bacterium]|jgi:cysteine desulfurase / selenocysteine lyase
MDLASQFPLTGTLIHLNHAAVAPWPRVTAEAVKAFADENMKQASLDYPRWIRTEERLRERIRQLVNARSASEIALVKNTSEGLSFVASGIDWHRGDNVVGIRQEFPSNRFPWLALESRGVAFRQLDLDSCGGDPEAALIALCNERTRLLSVSAVQYANGFRMDLVRLGEFCRRNGILFCVDAIQQAGAIPFDVRRICADFAVADGHKWMLAPEGLGFFYVREEVRDNLALTQYGWHMAQELSDYAAEAFRPAESGRRFECGSPNMLAIHALDASLGLLLETGIDEVWRCLSERMTVLRSGLGAIPGIDILSDCSETRLSGILTFRSADDDALFSRLQEGGVFCARRGGGIRLSPHCYTPLPLLETALGLIEG